MQIGSDACAQRAVLFHRVRSTSMLAIVATVVVVGVVPFSSSADAEVPAQCAEYTSPAGEPDPAGDYRCTGLDLPFHAAGVGRSTSPMWAGQWLFSDETGRYRMGWCTMARGVHPVATAPSHRVPQTFPNDPSGRRVGYLVWRYGATNDPLTAAGVWAVLHHYALDAAGSERADDPEAPLVSSLDTLAAASGRADLQTVAAALHDEADAVTGDWHLDLTVAAGPSPALGAATVTLLAGTAPVAGQTISVLVSGSDLPLAATTGADGTATVTVPLLPGTVTVVATTEAPGAAEVYRGTPATSAGAAFGAQLMVTAGTPLVLRETASIEVPEPAIPADEVDPDPLSDPGDVPSTPVPSTDPFPVTGGSADARIAAAATAALVAGVGLVGTVRRRPRVAGARRS